MKKRGRKATNCQKAFRKKTFSFSQYWLMYYTERYEDGTEKDYATFIKARSYLIAKTILIEKSKEDSLNVKVKAVLGYMLHKQYKHTNTNKLLSVSDWENIRQSAFPNVNNFLFKKNLPRPEGYTNRFNKSSAKDCKNIGFKRGAQNWARQNRKGVCKKLNERKGLVWNGGEWVKWDKEEMRRTKNEIINALVLNNNSRKKAAEHLKIGRSSLYKLMARCETRDWWNTEYPFEKPIPPRVSKEQRSAAQKKVMEQRRQNGVPFFDKSLEAEAKRIKNLRKAKAASRDIYRKSLIPKIKKALLANGNVRTKAAASLGVKDATFKRWMDRTKSFVNWSKEYPSSYNNEGKLTWKTVNK